MSYRVLARAYRSASFDEIVGQSAVATTLKNAIACGRVHHGYLFTGTRGVGKTSMARILAKALNCLSSPGPTVAPCRECDVCRAVSEGEDIDVVEIDAASNTGVDDIRELRTNAAFRPTRARFKIYIIDEVHMLSTAAFNALLKTLEEPPEHVKFILATTESHKVPATIQSRCQRFDFRAIDAATILEHLQRIIQAENVQADEALLRRIARLANGSMRDALSLLDKCLSYTTGPLTVEVADELIPPAHDELASAVIASVAGGDARGALLALDRALQSGRTVERFADHLIEHLRTLMILRVCGADTDLVDIAESLRGELVNQAARFDAAAYVFMIALLEELRRNVKYSGAGRALADAAMVRLSSVRQFGDLEQLLRQSRTPADVGARAAAPSPGTMPAKPGATGVSNAAPAPRAAAASAEPPSQTPIPSSRGSSATRPPSASPLPRPTISSSAVERANRDPLVRKLLDAVDGRLFSVRAADPPRAEDAGGSAGPADAERGT